MKIETKFFGAMDVDEKEVVQFEHGLPGFENERKYIFIRHGESQFYVMQSVDRPELAFVLVEMAQVVPDYDINLGEEVVAELRLQDAQDAMVFAITVLPEDISKATVNLAAPLIINTKEKRGKQVILNNPAYGLKHPLFSTAEAKVSVK